jgi:hypothetical protein
VTKALQAPKAAKILGFKDGESSTPNETQLSLINKWTRKQLTADEVYIYPILLCDNERDRDDEYFERGDLVVLAGLAPGVTGIFNHDWSADNQCARIFNAEVVDTNETNSRGVPYSYLKGWAYILRLEKYANLIAEIDGGIKKEVSIGFSYTTPICSIDGGDYRRYDECQHIKGRVYEKDLCLVRMSTPKEMYEYSHVAVPAQPAAGAIKGMGIDENRLLDAVTADKSAKIGADTNHTDKNITEGNEDGMKITDVLKTLGVAFKDDDDALSIVKDWHTTAEKVPGLEQQVKDLEVGKAFAEAGKQYLDHLKGEALRLGGIVDGKSFNAETMKTLFDKCSVEELKGIVDQYQSKADELYPPTPQSKTMGGGNQGQPTTAKAVNNDLYKI